MTIRYGNALGPVAAGPNGLDNTNLYQYTGIANNGDTVQMSQNLNEVIPAFTRLLGMFLCVSAANTGGPTLDVGYAATDGDVTTPGATNLTYFASGLSVSSAGRYGTPASPGNAPFQIPKDAWPVITVASGNLDLTGETLTFGIQSRYEGSP